MKKTLSVILALIMLMSCASVAFAADEVYGTYIECACENCKYKDCAGDNCGHAKDCTCCIYCDHLNEAYIIKQCVDYYIDDNGNRCVVEFCCAYCDGLWPCDCGTKTNCGCKTCDGSSIEINDGTGDPLLTPDQQEEVISGFQKVIKAIADAFNKFFDAVFKFLRIDEVLGN